MADSPRSRFHLPHWGWCLLAAVALVVGFVDAITYPGVEDGWPTIDAAFVFTFAASGIWLLFRSVDGGTRRLAIPGACIALVMCVGVVSIWLPYDLERQVIRTIERWGGSAKRTEVDFRMREYMPRTPMWRFKFFEPVVYVSLEGTKAGDGEIAQLSRLTSLGHLSRLKNLRSLWLIGTRVTDQGIGELRKALPQCTIHRF